MSATRWTEDAIREALDAMKAGTPVVVAAKVQKEVPRDWLLLDRAEDRLYDATCAEILETVSRVTGFSLAELKSEMKNRKLARARQIYYYACRVATRKSFPMIADVCGGRDHSTAHHGWQKVKDNRDKFEPQLGYVLMMVRRKEKQAA